MKDRVLLEKMSYKKIALILLGLFLVTLLPIIYCSFFNYANGDDLWEGAAAYRVLAEGGTVKDFFIAIRDWFIVDYYGWEGNWSSIILWLIPPNIWGEKVYCITAWIALFHLCGSIIYFGSYYMQKFLNANRLYQAIVSILVCFFVIQYMPSIKNGVFWYTGMINYTVPFSLCIMSFVWIDKYMNIGYFRYLVLTTIIFMYLGGAGYTPIVLAFEVFLLFMMLYLLKGEFRRKKRMWGVFIPFVLLIVGFVISALSPGNAIRGGDSYFLDIPRIFTTVTECLRRGFVGIFEWFLTVRPLILIIPLLVILTWEQIDIKQTKIKFEHPILVSTVLFLVASSIYAPEIYSQSSVSGGVPNTVYFTFLLTCIIEIIYLTCYVKVRYVKTGASFITENLLLKLRVAIVAGEIFFCIVAGRFLIGNMSGYMCYDFIKTGQLRDFEYQMQERLEILHNPEIKNAVVPEMNNEQGPFMHMALLKNPEAYTNRATARYYGKETVIAIPRTEYYEMFGYPEEMK